MSKKQTTKDINTGLTPIMQFTNISSLILGLDFDSVLTEFVKIKDLKTDEILDILSQLKEKEIEYPATSTKRMMCIQELVDRGEEDKLINTL